jgi:hypothetical protein
MKPVIYDPYPDYNSDNWRSHNLGTFHACQGPQRKPLSRLRAQDMVSVYPSLPKGIF